MYDVVLCHVSQCVVYAGLGNDERTAVQHQWMDGQVPVIVATISFGMGVDKANVRSTVEFTHVQRPCIHARTDIVNKNTSFHDDLNLWSTQCS